MWGREEVEEKHKLSKEVKMIGGLEYTSIIVKVKVSHMHYIVENNER